MAGVLVIGATGYIGLAVAQAARRDGYTVYAATRSESKTDVLAASELIPIVVDPKNSDALRSTVEKCEFVVDCSLDFADPNAVPNACLEAMRACEGANKKHYIYTSGGLVHGYHETHVTEDVVPPNKGLAWRIDIEKRITALSDVDGTVIRPSFVYGGSGGTFGTLFFTPPTDEGETLKITGNPDKRWSWVHVDDLADAYVRVMKRRSVSSGRVYDISEQFGPTFKELRVGMARMAGFTGEVEVVPAKEGMDMLMDSTFLIDPKRARDELGWVPRHTGIMSQLPVYYESWKACAKAKERSP